MTTRTLALRLAGPLQSWGEHSPFTVKNTLPTPTYSGLLGLLRAALGYPRQVPTDQWAWLRDLDLWLRCDRPGRMLTDYHSINPPPRNAWDSRITPPKRRGKEPFTVPFGAPIAPGSYPKAWKINERLNALPTDRKYLTDATFTVVINGPDTDIRTLHAAINEPGWQISLGRKACLPDWPIALGTTDLSPHEAVNVIPATTSPITSATVELDAQILRGHVPNVAGVTPITYTDNPIGAHPQHGYTSHTRHHITIAAPTSTRAALLQWSATNLEQHP